MVKDMPAGEICIFDFWTFNFTGEVQIMSQTIDVFDFKMINET